MMSLTRRMTIDEYVNRVKEEMVHIALASVCENLILNYLRPGFLLSAKLVSDLQWMARTMLCDHQAGYDGFHCTCSSDREWQPNHFLKSRYQTLEFQEYLKKHDDWEQDIGPHFAKLWCHRFLISENHFILYQEHNDPSYLEWQLYQGQTVAEVFQSLFDVIPHYHVDAHYVQIGVDGLPWLELTLQKERVQQWIGCYPEMCCLCQKKNNDDEDSAINIQWLYCPICTSGPYCSPSCLAKCNPAHQGLHFHNLQETCACGFRFHRFP